jgi:hypothetical protein
MSVILSTFLFSQDKRVVRAQEPYCVTSSLIMESCEFLSIVLYKYESIGKIWET